jgi:anti-sigma B factor antagonist
MEITSRNSGKTAILDLNGRLDVSTAALLKTRLQSIPPDQNQVVVNLKQVNFIDSMGLSMLVQGMKRFREKQGDLRLCEMQAPVRIIFELTRLDKAFEIFATEAEALISFH